MVVERKLSNKCCKAVNMNWDTAVKELQIDTNAIDSSPASFFLQPFVSIVRRYVDVNLAQFLSRESFGGVDRIRWHGLCQSKQIIHRICRELNHYLNTSHDGSLDVTEDIEWLQLTATVQPTLEDLKVQSTISWSTKDKNCNKSTKIAITWVLLTALNSSSNQKFQLLGKVEVKGRSEEIPRASQLQKHRQLFPFRQRATKRSSIKTQAVLPLSDEHSIDLGKPVGMD